MRKLTNETCWEEKEERRRRKSDQRNMLGEEEGDMKNETLEEEGSQRNMLEKKRGRKKRGRKKGGNKTEGRNGDKRKFTIQYKTPVPDPPANVPTNHNSGSHHPEQRRGWRRMIQRMTFQ
jgi:hypothetical protein